jgi:formyl-CoA transferase
MQLELEHTTAGKVASVANPIKMSQTPLAYDRAPPILGQHTNEVLLDILNLEQAAIDQLRDTGVIG